MDWEGDAVTRYLWLFVSFPSVAWIPVLNLLRYKVVDTKLALVSARLSTILLLPGSLCC